MPGLVPQVTCGSSSLASMRDELVVRRAGIGAQLAPGVERASQSAPAARAAGPRDSETSCRRVRSCPRVRRPRCSCCRRSCGLPWTGRGSRCRCTRSHGRSPPPMPMRPMMPRMMSLAVTPSGSSPSTRTSIVFGLRCGTVCVASTCSTSLVPMPKASAPKAPCVLVWLSPHTMVMPGWVRPSSGPMTWTMPCSGLKRSSRRMPNSLQLRSSASSCSLAMGSVTGWVSGHVGMLWSIVAMVRSGLRTLRPVSRRPSNACGEVTSWTRCRSMYSSVGSPGASRTTWASQIFSNSVREAMGGRSLQEALR